MQSKLFRRQRVAILDPDLRGREHARRVIRATGHAPYVFASIEEMQEVEAAERPFAMAYLGCADGDEVIAQGARFVVGLGAMCACVRVCMSANLDDCCRYDHRRCRHGRCCRH